MLAPQQQVEQELRQQQGQIEQLRQEYQQQSQQLRRMTDLLERQDGAGLEALFARAREARRRGLAEQE